MNFNFSPLPLLFMIAGSAGSGKGRFLKSLIDLKAQVIDLEKLACHNGSAFGNLSNTKQPSRIEFHTELFKKWERMDPSRPVFLEMEGPFLGSVDIPDSLYQQMITSPVIYLKTDFNLRVSNIIEDYSNNPKQEIVDSLEKLKPRIGVKAFATCLVLLDTGNLSELVKILLDYYDQTRTYQVDRSKIILQLTIDKPEYPEKAKQVMEFCNCRNRISKISF